LALARGLEPPLTFSYLFPALSHPGFPGFLEQYNTFAMKQVGVTFLVVALCALPSTARPRTVLRAQTLIALKLDSHNKSLGSGGNITKGSAALEDDGPQFNLVKAHLGANATDGAEGAVDAPARTVEHQKKAGGGYTKGSPLYNKQQEAASSSLGSYGVNLHANKTKHVIGTLLAIVIYIILVLILAYVYKYFKTKTVVDKMEPDILRPTQGAWMGGFRYHLLPCMDLAENNFEKDWLICLSACCCPLIRWADTISQVSTAKFYMLLLAGIAFDVLFFWFGLFLFGVYVWDVFFLIVVIIGVYCRQRIRLAYGHGSPTCSSVCMDILAWSCCTCCTIVQEAREVDRCPRIVPVGPVIDQGQV